MMIATGSRLASTQALAIASLLTLRSRESTRIAAEKTGRSARLIEYDPLYCDTIIRRWEKFTGKRAVLSTTDSAFEDIAEERLGIALEAAE